MDLIVNNIVIKNSAPEDKIIYQNDSNDGTMFVILKGEYHVQSLRFIRSYYMKQELTRGDKSGKHIVRILQPGNFCGEVSPVVNCRRSATVKSQTFGTYGQIDKESMKLIFFGYPSVKNYMWQHI